MRFTKQKRHRKIVRFYTACFGFREPFKVLCDGTFVHHLVSNNLSPETSASSALGAPVQLFTTQCVIEELKSLGSDYAKSFHAARKDYRLARCEHDQKVRAFDCIIEIIGENNPEHFFVASQDKDLRLKCQKIPGVPVMYGLRNALYLEPLSSVQREFVKASEEERSHVSDLERKLLLNNVRRILSTNVKGLSTAEEGNEDDVPGHHDFENRKAPRRGMDVKDKVQFKRNRAKGPNPLSCKKKKKPSSSGPSSRENDTAGSDAQRSRPRKRQRTRKTRTFSGAEGASS